MKSQKYFPNFTLIGMSIIGTYIGLVGTYTFLDITYNYFYNYKSLDLSIIFLLFVLFLTLTIVYHSINLFLKLYVIQFNKNGEVIFRHLFYLFTIKTNLKELYFRQKQKTSPLNDLMTNYTSYNNGKSIDLNWIKGRLFLITNENRNITIIKFGYDNYSSIKDKLQVNKIPFLK